MSEYIERYWRDATPADAIKEPPMVARFRDEDDKEWLIGKLFGFDRSRKYKWCGETRDAIKCQVYDAPDPPKPEPKYVPFEWQDREQLRGRWLQRKTDSIPIEQIATKFETGRRGLVVNGIYGADLLLKQWTFLDTGKPVGKEVVQ